MDSCGALSSQLKKGLKTNGKTQESFQTTKRVSGNLFGKHCYIEIISDRKVGRIHCQTKQTNLGLVNCMPQ